MISRDDKIKEKKQTYCTVFASGKVAVANKSNIIQRLREKNTRIGRAFATILGE